jgi:hypothetical protein
MRWMIILQERREVMRWWIMKDGEEVRMTEGKEGER